MSSNLFRRLLFDSTTFAYLLFVFIIKILKSTEDFVKAEMWNFTMILATLIVVGGVISHLLNKKNHKTLGEVLFQPAHKKVESPPTSFFSSLWGWHFLVLLGVSMVIGFEMTQSSLFELLDEQGFQGAIRLFKGLSTPNWALLPTAIINIVETIYLAFIATVLAIPIAFVLSFLCARNIMKHPVAFMVYSILRALLNVTRSIEALIWAVIFSVWVGIGPFAGMLALMVHSVASLAKQYSEYVETVGEGPIEGIESTGASVLQVVWYAIVPQVVLPYVSYTVYRWDTNLRMATIIGLVGGGGIGNLLIKYQGQGMWNEVGTVILVIAIAVWALDQASAVIRESLK